MDPVLRDRSQIMPVTKGKREGGVWKMLKFTYKGGRRITKMLTIADKRGEGVQANADNDCPFEWVTCSAFHIGLEKLLALNQAKQKNS